MSNFLWIGFIGFPIWYWPIFSMISEKEKSFDSRILPSNLLTALSNNIVQFLPPLSSLRAGSGWRLLKVVVGDILMGNWNFKLIVHTVTGILSGHNQGVSPLHSHTITVNISNNILKNKILLELACNTTFHPQLLQLITPTKGRCGWVINEIKFQTLCQLVHLFLFSLLSLIWRQQPEKMLKVISSASNKERWRNYSSKAPVH